MKTFKLTTDITFDATDIQDALEHLSIHFQRMSQFEQSHFEFEGEIEIDCLQSQEN